MTNPLGRCFLSYRRARLDEARLLIAAMRDFGIPTWHDLDNLPELPTDDALERALADPNLSSGVLWISPEVEDSPRIRKIEAPKILDRAAADDAFFVVPVCTSGVEYEDANIVRDPRFSLQNLSEWNVRNVLPGAPEEARIDQQTAARIASRVLQRRMQAIAAEPGMPIVLRAYTRVAPPEECDAALVVDWRHHFDGLHALPGTWKRMLSSAQSVAETIAATVGQRPVICEGRLSIPAALTLGAAFLQPLDVRAGWRQVTQGRPPDIWSLSTPATHEEVSISATADSPTGTDLAVLVSVTQNAEPGFGAVRDDLPSLCGVVHVHGPNKSPFVLSGSAEASSLAHTIANAIRAARDRWRFSGTTHVFLAGPIGLAFLLGQLSNTLRPIQTYEFDYEDQGGRYKPASLVRRVNAVQPL